MNEFYYVLITSQGFVLHDIFATSHKDLINKFMPVDKYFKGMYSPQKGHRLDEIDKYELIFSEA